MKSLCCIDTVGNNSADLKDKFCSRCHYLSIFDVFLHSAIPHPIQAVSSACPNWLACFRSSASVSQPGTPASNKKPSCGRWAQGTTGTGVVQWLPAMEETAICHWNGFTVCLIVGKSKDNPRVRKPKTKRLLLKFGGSENWQLLETETNQIAVQIYCMKSAVKQHANSS